MNTVNSSFWFDQLDDEKFFEENFQSDTDRAKNYNIYKLASAQRAISNFVSIVTNQNIPVEFNQRGESYTDVKVLLYHQIFLNQKTSMFQLVLLFMKVLISNYLILLYYVI